MGRRFFALCVFALLVRSVAQPLVAQSLADAARLEEERRKTLKAPAKVITNKDLAAVPPSTPQQSSSPPAPVEPAKGGDAAKQPQADTAKGAEAPKEPAKGEVKDQAYWSARMKELQTQLERDQSYSDALQSRINSLTTDFISRDDPAQRAVIERDRQKAVAELARLKDAIQKGKKSIADLEEQARRAGVPPGWLR
jgi:hypothetical protein